MTDLPPKEGAFIALTRIVMHFTWPSRRCLVRRKQCDGMFDDDQVKVLEDDQFDFRQMLTVQVKE